MLLGHEFMTIDYHYPNNVFIKKTHILSESEDNSTSIWICMYIIFNNKLGCFCLLPFVCVHAKSIATSNRKCYMLQLFVFHVYLFIVELSYTGGRSRWPR